MFKLFRKSCFGWRGGLVVCIRTCARTNAVGTHLVQEVPQWRLRQAIISCQYPITFLLRNVLSWKQLDNGQAKKPDTESSVMEIPWFSFMGARNFTAQTCDFLLCARRSQWYFRKGLTGLCWKGIFWHGGNMCSSQRAVKREINMILMTLIIPEYPVWTQPN